MRLIPKLSLDMVQTEMPEKVALLVTETFDSVLLGEHVLETMLHAWRNFLAPGCCMVPVRAEFFVVPEECGQVRRAAREPGVWRGEGGGGCDGEGWKEGSIYH